MTDAAQTLSFQAETRQLLDIVIHSLYSQKEIFLRELVSNASDAIDRRRFEALTRPELMDDDARLEIRIDTDPEARTLMIQDNGIGMSRQEVIDNLGTIAKSGTRELMRELEKSSSPEAAANLIGQFGVGFYSVFMVADRVTVVTRRAGEEKATRWESEGGGEFEIDEASRFFPGTTITLHLKPADAENGLEDYTEVPVLKRLIKRYSDFVAYPITVKEEQTVPELDGDGKPIEGKTRSEIVETTVNSQQPIWSRPEAEVTDEEYAEFYRHISHDWGEPLDRLLLRAEGRIEYRALLYVPATAPFDLFYRDAGWGLQLYVRRVLIHDRFEDLLPPYLRFVRGVVESDDLPLNVSREMVQQDRHIAAMRKWLTRKTLEHLATLGEDEERYGTFWGQFGRVLKEGVGPDPDNRDRLLPLLRFESSYAEEGVTSLASYVERMAEDQTAIYYLTGESRATVESSPHLESYRKKGYEVLYLTDPVDEFMTQFLREFDGKPLRPVDQGEAELGSEDERKEREETLKKRADEAKDLLTALGEALGERVSEVRLSSRLTDSPACLITGEGGISPRLERLLRQTEGAADLPRTGRILELNPDHRIFRGLEKRYAEEAEACPIPAYAELLLGYAYLAEGSELEDRSSFLGQLTELMANDLGAVGK